MKMWLQTVLLVASIVATTSKECTDTCFCQKTGSLQCDGRDLTQPPAGYFPQIYSVYLADNKISVLHKYALTGFPRVNSLRLYNNELEELDWEVWAPLTELYELFLSDNRISTIIASSGAIFEKLGTIYMQSNNLTSLDPDAFLVAPNLKNLFLVNNPIVVPSGQAVLNHPSIIFLDMSYASSLGACSFTGLPKVEQLYLENSGITNITGAFVANSELWDLFMITNKITEVTAGTFAKSAALTRLLLSENPLTHFNPSAVTDAVPKGGDINIRDTPLACECDYESLYWWTKGKGVSLNANCRDFNRCLINWARNEE